MVKPMGDQLISYRAEACGMWPLLLFITRIFEFYEEEPTNKVSLYCNNESLVDKIKNRSRPDFPNDSLESYWDIIIHNIIILLKQYNQSIKWIASHQDDDKDFKDLTLPSQLNCEADKLADAAHKIHPPTAPF